MSTENPKEQAGRKKCPMQLLPMAEMADVAWVMGFGADRYTPWNWRKTPIMVQTYVGAIMRHMTAIQSGEDIDPESGRQHWAHIAAGCLIVMDARRHGMLVDDRPGAEQIQTPA